jgi:CrcB protein
MLISYLFVGLGGALGAMARVGLIKVLPSFLFGIPLGIMSVNVFGCFVLGALTEFIALFWNASWNIRYFMVPGFLGGFTTFSAFSLEFGLLYEKGLSVTALIYAVLSVVLSIAGFFGGLKLIRLFH